MRLHSVALPHTRFAPEFSWCAYTTKVGRFAKMMTDAGCEVVTYGNGEAELAGKYVQIDDTSYPEYFVPPFEATDWVFSHFNAKAIAAIYELIEPGDIVCLIGGSAQQPIADALSNWPVVEWGIGYAGVFARYKVFESYAWQHHVMGISRPNTWQEWAQDDAVIPNFFDPVDFSMAVRKSDYFAFMGRVCRSKGVDTAVAVCRQAGVPLKIAGRIEEGSDAEWVSELSGEIEYVGTLEPKERSVFLSEAKATLCPTRFLEPFCGVHVESMLCGTPVIVPDFGVFTETVDGHNGSRCRTFDDYIDALGKNYNQPETIRRRARARFSLEAVAPLYLDYFDRVSP